jgi:hypothetical protein
LKTTRAAFIREALTNAIARHREAQHRNGYEKAPENPDELSRWASEQVWPE